MITIRSIALVLLNEAAEGDFTKGNEGNEGKAGKETVGGTLTGAVETTALPRTEKAAVRQAGAAGFYGRQR
jgi:hypothetical protein